jgi:hypothetical protein
MKSLSAKIKEVLETRMPQEEYERRLENFVSAAYDTGFPADCLDITKGDPDQKLDRLWKHYQKEIQRVTAAC